MTPCSGARHRAIRSVDVAHHQKRFLRAVAMPQSAQRTHIAMGLTVYTHASRTDATPLRDESCDLDCKITDARPACPGRRAVPRHIVLAVTSAALLLGHATAFADCEPGLPRTDVAAEQRRAGQWNLAWRIANTAGATAQFAVA